MLKSRVITAAILLLTLMVSLFWLPEFAWQLLIVVMVMQGAVEWGRLSQFSPRIATLFWWATLLLMGGLVALDIWVLNATQMTFIHLMFYTLSGVLWLVIVPAWLMTGYRVKHPFPMWLTGWLLLVPTGIAMIDLRAVTPGPWVLLMLMALVWVADSAAYFAGRRFGRNKLAPDISPGKTWEGVVGALAGVTVYVSLVWVFSPRLNQHEILPILLLAAWWWVALAVIGDLFESLMKRQAGMKDSGALLPGHGGLLDRIDALTSTLPLAAMVIFFQKLG